MLKAPQIFLQTKETGSITEENGIQEETWRKKQKSREERKDMRRGG
jgi:hypothetical protein